MSAGHTSLPLRPGDALRHIRVRVVIETVALRGSGTQDRPFREVTQYWDADRDTELLAERDPSTDRGSEVAP